MVYPTLTTDLCNEPSGGTPDLVAMMGKDITSYDSTFDTGIVAEEFTAAMSSAMWDDFAPEAVNNSHAHDAIAMVKASGVGDNRYMEKY